MNDSQTTLPKHLYHYTSQKGLLGILEHDNLWMTNILYLNDSSEFKHTLDLVKTELEIWGHHTNYQAMNENCYRYKILRRLQPAY
jgi:hypothetical protein